MQIKRLKIIVLIILAFGISSLQAQTSLNTSGGNIFGGGGSVSYSVGQVFYYTNVGTNGSLAEGVQQAYEISVVAAIEEAKGIKLLVAAYPNPTTDYLMLSIDEFTDCNSLSMSYQLYDMQGKLLEKGNISNKETLIDMTNLVSSSYYVKVLQGKSEIKTFKIIKY